ncbi:MAG: maleylpyruvate isomerase N-terminal domain-containing protein [Desulfobacterales bacterium]
MKSICNDLAAEQASLDDMVKSLNDGWQTVTPFFNWTIKDEISHLAYFDMAARLSATDRKEFAAGFEGRNWWPASVISRHLRPGQCHWKCQVTNLELLAWWRKERKQLLEAFESVDRIRGCPGMVRI